MKILIFIILLLGVQSESLTKTNPCTCQQIKSSNDCSQLTQCQWNSVSGACEARQTTDTESYCTQITTCPSTGCVMINKTCKAFSGCTVYQVKTHTECQAITPLCTSDGEKCIDVATTCDSYTTQEGCKINTQQYPCYWDTSKCIEIQTCQQLPTSYSTHTQCYQMGTNKLLKCTAKEGGGCTDMQDDCTKYQQLGCVQNTSQTVCFWDGSSCKDKTCVNAPTTYTTQQECQDYLSGCSVNATNSGCMTSPAKCEDYTVESQCIQLNGIQCFWNTCTENQTNCKTQCQTYSCENANNSYTTDSLCQQFKNECTVNNSNNGCMKRNQKCTDYSTQYQCVKTLDESQLCYWNGTKCMDKLCENAQLQQYTLFQCNKFMSQCTLVNNKCGLKQCNTFLSEQYCSLDYQNNKCVWSGSCTLRTCQNGSTDYTTHNECNSWLSTCTVNSSLKGCQSIESLCTKYTKQEQCYKIINGDCLWQNKQCVQKTCNTASTDITTDIECSSYLTICMIDNDQSGCIQRLTSCNLLNQYQCSQTLSGSLCFWNGTTCSDRVCANANYNTYTACNQFMSTCTVQYDGTQFNGCIDKLNQCSAYVYEYNCIDSLVEGRCIWNKKASPNACEVRSCSNSDQTTSDAACNNFLQTCTVNSAKTGCMERYDKCSQYTNSINCVKNKSGGECLWYNNSCLDRTCDYADKTYTTHDQCQSFSTKCTTNGKGCTSINQCTSYNIQTGCIIDQNNNLCAFQPSCNLQQCSDAPQSFSTDLECKNFKSTCTTNGNGCVQRLLCSDAYIEQACQTDQNGNKCAWINNRCINYGCSSAPSKYVTEKECQLYKQGCTVNQSGGCIEKGACKDAKIMAACTTDKNGNECEFSAAGCRDKICSDYQYTTHTSCYNANQTCTTDGTKCVSQSVCSKKTQSGCYYGTDGPCLWVNNACYLYTSCQSLQFTTHTDCYSFNKECTTNGINCIPIDKCQNLKQESCYQGTDGTCVFTPDTLDGLKKCKLYVSCSTAIYNTHEQCQNVNTKCTTDESTCIELMNCTDYKKQSNCKINANGGQCFYDETAKTCNDLQCSNLQGTSHTQCNGLLKTCTSDLKKCINMDKCETYDKAYCNQSTGTDGKCQYDPSTLKCRLALCTELVDNCTQIKNCVDSGIGCVALSTCDKYQTEKGCQQGGSDGLCVWYLDNGEGKCKLMSACSDASSNKDACLQKNWTCQWTETSTKTTCAQHTCSSKAKETGSCLAILDFTQTKYDLCAFTSQQCISIEFASLTQSTCFQATAYTYTWDTVHQVCLQCGTTYTNNTTNTTNQTSNNTNQTQSSYNNIIIIQQLLLLLIISIQI